MYIDQMHIEVKLLLQKINAEVTRKLLPQEIDWILNKQLGRFVTTKVRPKVDASGKRTGGFEILQDDVDAIKMLVRSNIKLPAYVYDDRTVFSPLPGDYSYLTQDESVIRRLPPGVSYSQTRQTLYLNLFPIQASQAATGPYYRQLQLSLGGTVIYDIQQYASARGRVWNGYSAASEVWALWEPMLRELIDKGYNTYWEYYGDQYFPRTMIIVTPSASSGQIVMDGVTTSSTSQQVSAYTRDYAPSPMEYQANRLTASNISSSLLEVSFFGTQPELPISQIAGRQLYVYPNKTFIVGNTIISYVRKPRKMSLILGVDCELSPEYHGQICDLSVEYIRGVIADPNWQQTLQDNMKRTPLE